MTKLKVSSVGERALEASTSTKHVRSSTKMLHLNITGLARELDTAASKLLKQFNLTPTRFDILEELLIQGTGMTQAELARKLRVQPANILAALRPLIQRGWITRTQDERNKKEKLIYINPDYIAHFHEVIAIYYEAMEKVFSDPIPEELDEWLRRTRIRLSS